MKPILHTIENGGSGFGLSYWSGFAKCPRRALLDVACKERGEPDSNKTKNTEIGAFYHAYKELYHGGKAKRDSVVEFADTRGGVWGQEDNRATAEALFRFYSRTYSPNYLGTPISIEELFKPSQEMNELAGFPGPVSAKLDMIVKLSKRDVERLQPANGSPLGLEPGYWLVDWKTSDRRWANIDDMYGHALQFWWYQMVWNYYYPERRLKGAIAEVVYKVKEPYLELIVSPAVTEKEEMSVKNFFQGCYFIKQHMGDWANSNACFMPSNCLHFVTGACNRV